MLNKDGVRELAYVVRIDNITAIPGYDRVELAHVGGWTIVVGKGEFQIGDPAIYFEIDSKLPEVEPFTNMEFLTKKHYKIKTQKMCKSLSSGLLMSAANFGWTIGVDNQDSSDNVYFIIDDKGEHHYEGGESRFLTEKLSITYAVPDDNVRKAAPADKYKKMAQRHGKLFSKQPFRWLMKRDWGKKVLFLFFGRKRDKRAAWPNHIASKTDVERVQNMMWVLNNKEPYVATEKIDGSSCSIMAERTRFGRIKYYICSRNVVFEDENQKCFYDENIYFEAYHKYNLKEKITQILNDYNLQNVALQMEVFGPTVQKRDYSLQEREAMIFHIVSNGEKFPMDKVVEICEKYDLPHVPIVNDNFILPDTIEELQAFVEGEGSRVDGGMREGIVFYDKKTGQQYFKFVSPEFLLKFHQ